MLIDVDDDQERLGGKELKAAQPLQVVAFQVQRPERLPSSSAGDKVTTSRSRSRSAERFFFRSFDPFEPTARPRRGRQDQLVFHRLCVARRIDRPGGCGTAASSKADDVDSASAFLYPATSTSLGAARACPARPGP
jgi:hypothetical protein